MEDQSEKDIAEMGDGVWDAYDKTPVTDSQLSYLKMLTSRLDKEGTWDHLNTSLATQTIDKLNELRRLAGVPYRPLSGFVQDDVRYQRR